VKYRPGSWVLLRSECHDEVVARACNCEGDAIRWWNNPHPLVVMVVEGSLLLLSPVCSDPNSKSPSADPVELRAGDGPASHDSFLHVEVAVWASVTEVEVFRGGYNHAPQAFPPKIAEAYYRAFRQTWDAIDPLSLSKPTV
jgi:hypothetical protein